MIIGSLSSIIFVLKSLVLSVIKQSNLAVLMFRLITIGMVLAHYTIIEGIDYWTQAIRSNEHSFIKLVLIWHLASMNFKIIEESRRFKNVVHSKFIFAIALIIVVSTVLIVLLTPILAWFNYEITSLDTSYWSLRYLLMFLYILMNFVTSMFPYVFNFLFFISDGVILSQLTSIYLFNELSMSVLLTLLPVLFVIHNHLLVRGIQTFTRDEAAGKMSFVRLIGRHDAVFMFVIYALFTTVFTIVDTLASDWRFAANLWYLVYALYAFGKLMDHKQSGSRWLYRLSLLTILVFIAGYTYSLSRHENPFPQREFPLYSPVIVN